MKKILLIFLPISLAMIGLSSFTADYHTKNELLGVWIESDYEGGNIIYTKAKSFNQNKPGVSFQQDGKLIKRQNVGFCGTPPITYGDSEGTWELTSDSTFTIKCENWRGKEEQDWLIVALSDEELIIKINDRKIIRNLPRRNLRGSKSLEEKY